MTNSTAGTPMATGRITGSLYLPSHAMKKAMKIIDEK